MEPNMGTWDSHRDSPQTMDLVTSRLGVLLSFKYVACFTSHCVDLRLRDLILDHYAADKIADV